MYIQLRLVFNLLFSSNVFSFENKLRWSFYLRTLYLPEPNSKFISQHKRLGRHVTISDLTEQDLFEWRLFGILFTE